MNVTNRFHACDKVVPKKQSWIRLQYVQAERMF